MSSARSAAPGATPEKRRASTWPGRKSCPPTRQALGEAELRSRRLSAGCRTMRINARADAPWLRSIELSLDVSFGATAGRARARDLKWFPQGLVDTTPRRPPLGWAGGPGMFLATRSAKEIPSHSASSDAFTGSRRRPTACDPYRLRYQNLSSLEWTMDG